MSIEEKPNSADLMRKALQTIKKSRARIDELESQLHDSIAIVGIGCRFPKSVEDVGAFWDLLRDGVDGITVLQNQRWPMDEFFDADPEKRGKIYTRGMGIVEDVQAFDAEFFGIPPLEARHMDPQQRLLLETAHQALEHAGCAPESIKGSKTGVFIGICHSDYWHLQSCFSTPEAVTPYDGIGNSHAVSAGRLSYWFDVEGPCMAIDTACSSSLLAVHLAVQSLRTGESNMAIAGGVNVIYNPATSIAFCKARMLSPVGKCKTFDAGADGYVRGEGCGIVILKRLSDALRDNDNVVAVIKGSAANQDGKSQGIVAPNELQQEKVIRSALANARLSPEDIDFVEAHGTGTILGDPVEINALGAVFGKARSKTNPLLVGSSKTNVGHMEAAAGIGGLIKLALALQHEAIPPHINFAKPNPYIPWNELPIKVTDSLTPWPWQADRKRAGGVSSFAFSGSNVHIVLEEAPQPGVAKAVEHCSPPAWQVVNFSGRNKVALDANVEAMALFLGAQSNIDLAGLAHTTRVGRAQREVRMSLAVASVTDLQAQLIAYRNDPAAFNGVTNSCPMQTPKVAFLFSGQGSQYAGVAKSLYEYEPRFKAALDRVTVEMEKHIDKPLLSILWGDDAGLIDDTQYTQPALFSVEYALAEMWKAWGVKPSYLIGHSVGEYAAACYAGVFSMEEAAKLVAARGRLMQTLCDRGEMVALQATEDKVRALIHPFKEHVDIAAINGPASLVVSGDCETIAQVVAAAEQQSIKARKLDTSHAFHSRMMEPMLAEFANVAKTVEFKRPRQSLISNLSGAVARAEIATADYWVRHVREPVHFAQGMEALFSLKVAVCIEMGPGATLIGMGRRCVDDAAIVWAPSLRQGRSDDQQLTQTLNSIWCAGVAVDWRSYDKPYRYRVIEIPTYRFQRKVHWLDVLPPLAGKGESAVSWAGWWLQARGFSAKQPAVPQGEMYRAMAPAAGADTPPSNPTAWLNAMSPEDREALVLDAIRAEVSRSLYLTAADVNPLASFAGLGIDSLMLMELRSKLQALLGTPIPVSQFFEHPNALTLARGLLAWWEELQACPAKRQLPLHASVREGTLQLSYSQEQLWFLHELMPASSAYNIAAGIRIRGKIDYGVLERSIDAVIVRHEILRTSFCSENGEAHACIVESLQVSLPVQEVAGNSEVDAWAAHDAGLPFVLDSAPLFRLRLLRLDEEHHVLLITMHHIITDGWSFGVLLRDFSMFYQAFERNEQPLLPVLPVQYADYVAWQRRWLSGETLESMLAFWQQELRGVAPLQLNTDKPRPQTLTFQGCRRRFELGAERAAALRGLCEAEGITLFIPLLAAFSVALQRDSGQDDFVIGTMSANRGLLEIEGSIGLFVNALPLRVSLEGDPAVRDLFERLRRRMQGAMAHQDAPFDLIVNAVQRERDGARNPLFQAQLLLQPFIAPPPAAGREIEIFEIDTQTAKRDLTVTIFNDGLLSGHIEYSTDLFDAQRMEFLLQHLQILLDAFIADSAQRLSALPFLTDVELALHGQLPGPGTAGIINSASTFVELFERIADRIPDAIAVQAGERALSYSELDRKANCLAHWLKSRGVGPNVPVELRVDRSVDMAIGILGILKSGGIYVPIDSSYPADRISFMRSDAAIRLAVTQVDGDEVRAQSSARPKLLCTATDPAYIIYTSGSSGQPKGVVIAHGSVLEYVEALRHDLAVAEGDVFLHTASISFSSSIRQMLIPLAAGASVVIASNDQRRDPLSLVQVIRDKGVTVVDLVPTMLRQLVNNLKDLPAAQSTEWLRNRVRLMLTASEPLQYSLVRDWYALAGDNIQWINMYGQTETTGIVSLCPVPASDWSEMYRANGIVPVGRPRSGVQLLVLDTQLRPTPLGVAGQLHVAGTALAQGYIGDASASASRFLEQSPTGHSRLYATGDVVRLGWDGNIEFIGRNDLQIKVRGFRIELGEIERVLLEQPDVSEAVVVPFDDNGEKYLVAFLTLKNKAAPIQNISAHAGAKLPAYMLPRDYITLEAMPLTPTGKLNRGALNKPDSFDRQGEKEEYIAPRPGIEAALATIWQELLRMKSVSAGDNFFSIGGHSLLAVQLRARIQSGLGINVPLGAIFEEQSLSALALRLESCNAIPVSAAPLVRIDRGASQPLSIAQMTNWATERSMCGARAN